MIIKNLQVPKKEIIYYIIAIFLCLFFLVWVMQLWSADLKIPFYYIGDSMFEGESIKGIIDTGAVFQNPFVGMPTGLLSYDYPTNCFLDLYIMKLISFVFPNWALTMNIFFLLTFFLTTVTTLFVLRQFNVLPAPAIIGSLLFTFVPFHFLRGEYHLVLSSYYLLPLMILVIFWIFEDDFLLSRFEKGLSNPISLLLNGKSLLSIVICIAIALEFIYYPIFSCFFLLIAGFCTTISRKKWRPLLNAGILIGVIVLCIFIANIPAILYQHDNGKNLEVAIRGPGESENYGLKIIQLLLPIPGHRIPQFAYISDLYAKTAPLVNENSFATLGIIGSIGFIILIVWVFYYLFSKFLMNNNETLKKIHQLSVLNLTAVLLATVGGFGTIFAYWVSPQIRCYNRISIFIAFFCIVAIVLLLDLLLRRYSPDKTKKWVILGCLAFILLFGIYDQTSENFVPNYNNTKTTFISDEHFIKNIESIYPKDTLIFQLPYMSFPEYGMLNQMSDYDHFRAYLHSDNIRWSYGTMKGREGDSWQKNIVGQPSDEMVEDLSFAGFNGIYVDTFGYADNGNEMISSLSSTLQVTPIISENKRLYFFDMTGYNDRLKSKWTPEKYAEQKERIVNPLQFEWHDGFSGLESSQGNTWRWCSSNGTLIITNPSYKEKSVLINTTFFTGYPEYSQLKIESPVIEANLQINNGGYYYQREIVIPPGKTTIKFSSDAKRVDAPKDPRYLVFRMDKFQISEIK